MGLFEGKRALVMGWRTRARIAWGIAQALHARGARLGFTYSATALERRVRPLAESVGADLIAPCDVTDDAAHRPPVRRAWTRVFGALDVLVHAVAFAKREELVGRFVDTWREGFRWPSTSAPTRWSPLARAPRR